MIHRTLIIVAAAIAAAGYGPGEARAQSSAPDQPVVMTTGTVEWHPDPPGLPAGAEFAVLEGDPFGGPFTLRLRLPAGYRIPAHTHPLIENVTVISGAVYVGNGDALDTSRGVRVAAGGFVALPEGSSHYAWTEEPTVIQIHSARPFAIEYVDPGQDPRRP
jgi:hypothetical protein